MHFQWPEFSEIFGKLSDRKGWRNQSYFFRQWIRFSLRSFLARKQINPFVELVNAHPRRIDLFSHHLSQSHWVVCKDFLNRKFDAKKRLEALKYNLIALEDCLGDELFASLLRGEERRVFALPWGLECVLRLNGAFEEGILAFELKFGEMYFYHCSIAFCEHQAQRALLIPCMQGLGNGEEVRKSIKEATKKCFGLRPQNLLLESLRELALYLGITKILGVQQTQQIRYKPLGKKNYFVDYNLLWKDCGGELEGEYFHLKEVRQKDLSEIPSQKRSMYKKRFALLQDLKEEMRENFEKMGIKQCL